MTKSEIKAALDQVTKTHAASAMQKYSQDQLAGFFAGDVLKVAVKYQECLNLETAEYGICGRTLANSRSRTFRFFNKPVIKDAANPCHRCSGTGAMPYKHIKGGVCFRCNGTGSSKSARAAA